MLPGFVSGSHFALRLPSVDLHSTPRICIPCPQETEHCDLKEGGVASVSILNYFNTPLFAITMDEPQHDKICFSLANVFSDVAHKRKAKSN